MKTCLHRLVPIAILSLSSLAQPLSAQTMYDKSQYLEDYDVKISQPYTPFGNRSEFNRYGDDGSKCVLDANGVLTWIGKKGEVRLLPDSSKGVPLFVTNTECLVWVNRFVDYANYPDRPDAQLRLYRSTPESNAVTSQDVSFQGKEIIDTPQVTTTTGTLTFVSATRKDNKEETVINAALGTKDNLSDDCELRFYRLTFDAGVQFVGSQTVQILNVENFDTNTNGPEIQALGYGSDGSIAIKVIKERVQPSSPNPNYEDRTYWIDNQGRFLRVVEDQSTLNDPPATDPKPCSRVLFVSNTRLVYEHTSTATTPATGIQDQRRSISTGRYLRDDDRTDSVTGDILDIWNYSQVGVNRYFYTVDGTGTIINTYRVTGDGISTAATTTLTGGLTISSATMTGTINPKDGSALLVTEDGDELIWLHSGGTAHTALPNSNQASALFVDKDQAVIWENAKAPVDGDGQIPAAVVMHYKQVGTVATTIRTDGNKTLLNTSRITPDPAYWLFTTAIKPDASTARLTTYKLATVEIANVDTDKDGLLDYYETNTGTFVSATETGTNPNTVDYDSDGLNDGSEVTDYKTNPTDDDSDNDTLKDGAEVLTHLTNPLLSDTDGDSLSDSAELNTHKTDPLKKDTDGDALEDDDEISLGTDPRDTDTDNDNLLDGDEVSRGTKPKDPDTDEDGLSDGAEVLTHLTNPLVKDSDGDGISDFDEVTKGSNPNDANNPKNIDTDKEGLKDYEELFVYNTDPTKVDTDGDGLSDYEEVRLHGTNPLLADTDGDGVDDYREVAILFTDPNDGSFAASSAGSAVSFSEGRGNYEGLLYNSNDGLGFKLTLNVTNKGAFSGSLGGNFGNAPLRGKFMGDGTWSGRITQGNAGFLRMKLAEQDDGSYGVQGSLETPTGGIYYYQARRAIGFPARKLTSEASAIDDAAGPTGSAVATGGIGKGGKVTQQIYNPDGSRATYAGSVLEGEFMALYARTKGGVPTVMLGNVALRNNLEGKSNFDGIVRLFNRNYDQERSLSGAYYSPPTMGTLPLPAMPLTANNAIFSWSDGRFDGVNKVASWMPNKVTVPTTQNDKATPVYDRKTGLLKLTYTRTDPAKGLINAQSNAFAVVVQGKDKLSGFYTGAGSSGGFSAQENSAGLQPDFTNISPLNKTVSASSISYNVDVTSTGDWTVDTTGASWVTASVKSGTGSGTVVITVGANATNARREASIRIAGFTHTITQSYR